MNGHGTRSARGTVRRPAVPAPAAGRVRAAARRSGRALFVALLVALAVCVLAPAAAASPDAGQIDAYLSERGSPMAGSGATFVAEGQEHGVDPAFLVAIAGAESGFGQYLFALDGDQATFNAFNWFYGPTWSQSDFASWDEAIARVAEGLAGPLYYGSGLYSVDAIAPKYCPDGTQAWVTNVTALLLALGGDPADTRIPATAATTPVGQPGSVELDGPVKFARKRHVLGGYLIVKFTLTNAGGSAVTLQAISLSVRGPGEAAADMVALEPFELPPGGGRYVEAALPLKALGRWFGWIEVWQNGTVVPVGEPVAFTYRVKLPRNADVCRWVLRERTLKPAP